jgi:RNA polymerase-binding transcription factor
MPDRWPGTGRTTVAPIDEGDVRARLAKLKQELEALSDMSAGSRDAVTLDQTSVGRLSRIDAIQQQEMALATERNRARDLARVEAALRRLEDGAYGDCIVCGEPISEKRLALDPAAPTCIACAK